MTTTKQTLRARAKRAADLEHDNALLRRALAIRTSQLQITLSALGMIAREDNYDEGGKWLGPRDSPRVVAWEAVEDCGKVKP